MRALILFLALWPTAIPAEILVATRMIPAQSVLAAGDVALKAGDNPAALTDAALAVGKEARTTLYPGRAIRASDLTAPGLVDRNQIVPLIFRSSGLSIRTEGRALDRGAAGETIRVMNLQSRNTTSGRVQQDGTVVVGP